MGGGFRVLHLVRPFLAFLPEVQSANRKVPFREKVIYTVISLFIFLVCTQLPLYGIHSTTGADPLKCLEHAGVSPEELEAEVISIKKTFKNRSELKMNGTKSMIGHGLGAAGGVEAIACMKAITTGWLHPTINQDNLEPEVDIDIVPNVKKQHEVNVGSGCTYFSYI